MGLGCKVTKEDGKVVMVFDMTHVGIAQWKHATQQSNSTQYHVFLRIKRQCKY